MFDFIDAQFPYTFLDNKLSDCTEVIFILLLGFAFRRLISKIIGKFFFKLLSKYASDTNIGVNDFNRLLVNPLAFLVLILTFYLAFERLHFPLAWELAPESKFGLKMLISKGFQMVMIFSIARICLRVVDFFGLILMYRASLTPSKTDDQLIPFFKDSIKVILIIFILFFTLGYVFKLNIASIVAGLGIGGLAVALAAKESLENLFGSFTIFLDKPFVVGDLIKVEGVEGHVEKIGFRSTRIRTLEKSFVTIPNKKMVDSELDNLSLRSQRRGRFNIGLTYNTTESQFKAIINDIKEYIDEHPQTLNGETRVRLHEFGDSSINILVSYLVDTIDLDIYLNVREEINYKIMAIVMKHGSSFAFPSRTVYLEK
jgi:MscS family membrane protein